MKRTTIIVTALAAFLSGISRVTEGKSNDPAVVHISSSQELMANIGRDNIKLILAPQSTDPGGRYLIPACAAGVDERSTNDCGQLQQGADSVLTGGLQLELDWNGVPTGAELSSGAIVDCGALPPDRTLSCIAGGDESTIERLTIENGAPPTPFGFEHRVGILIVAEKDVAVREVVVRNTHRAILIKGESDRRTRAEIRGTLIDGTELAGIFVMGLSELDAPIQDSRYRVRLESNRLTSIGFHPILIVSFSALRTEIEVEVLHPVIEPLTLRGISVFTARAFPDVPAIGNETSVSIRGGRLVGEVSADGQVLGGVGLAMENFNRGVSGTDNYNNSVSVEVKDMSFVNLTSDVRANYRTGWGAGNVAVLDMKDSAHSDTVGGTTIGLIEKVADDSGNDWIIDGSEEKFNRGNQGFDTSGVSADFEN